jgi:5-methylcytosine-specific restriction enzyme subunit McrC
MLCYAWDSPELLERVEVGTAGVHSVADLLARVIVVAVRDVLRRGLDREYVDHEEDVVGVRGRIDFGESTKRMLLPTARTRCRFDELSPDVLQNQIVRETVRLLSRVDTLDKENRIDLQLLWGQLDGVSRVRLDPGSFTRVRLHRNNAAYRLLLAVCRFAFDSMLVDESGTGATFLDFGRERMERIFETFIRRFYELHAPPGSKAGRRIEPWQRVTANKHVTELLPQLETDVVIESALGTLIIDAKFYAEPLVGRFDKKTIRSEHLNQIFAYVRNFEAKGYPPPVEGMLLYASTTSAPDLDVECTIHGHRVRAQSLDLGAPWPQIEDMLRVLAGWRRVVAVA